MNDNKGKAVHTLTIPATKAPQLNVPMSFGIEINLECKHTPLALFFLHHQLHMNRLCNFQKKKNRLCTSNANVITVTYSQGAPSH